ncbi:MAG: AAA family ATPase [Sulfuricurvum sp.]
MSHIRLESLYLDNFKSFKDTRFEFGKLNCLIAPNNAGKSNLIEALEFCETALFENIAQAVANVGASAIRNYKYNQNEVVIHPSLYVENIVLIDDYLYDYKTNMDVKFTFLYDKSSYIEAWNIKGKIKRLKIDKKDLKSFVRRAYNDDIKKYVANFDEYLEKLTHKRYISFENDLNSKESYFKIVIGIPNGFFKNIFGTDKLFSSFYFHPKTIKENQKFEEKYLLKDGTNLAYFLKTLDKETFDDISTSLIGEVDLVESIELVDGAFPTVMFNENTTGVNNQISQQRVSDGTIHFLSLMTALLTSKSSCLLFEEPERHMHMKTLSYILNTMRDSDKQIFFTTHSTEMLGELELDEIIFMFRDYEGDTKGIRAKDIKNIKKIMKIYKNDIVEMIKIGILDGLEDELL